MEYRRLSNLEVSAIGMGCNQLGLTCDQAGAKELVSEAIDSGITIFDVADEYGRRYWDPSDPSWGVAEEFLGNALEGRRAEVIVATKFGVRRPTQLELGGASAKWIRRSVEDSLRRLRTEYIDLYQLHVPDPDVPIEETLDALSGLVDSGKVRVTGCCNLSPAQLEEASRVADTLNVERFASVQIPVNLLEQQKLAEIAPVAARLGVTIVPYYPLARGLLTGKYRRGVPPPASSRVARYAVVKGPSPTNSNIELRPIKSDEATQRSILTADLFDVLERLESFAVERGHSILELAFAWLLSLEGVYPIIAGVSRSGQAAANAACSDWRLSPAELEELSEIVV